MTAEEFEAEKAKLDHWTVDLATLDRELGRVMVWKVVDGWLCRRWVPVSVPPDADCQQSDG